MPNIGDHVPAEFVLQMEAERMAKLLKELVETKSTRGKMQPFTPEMEVDFQQLRRTNRRRNNKR